MFASVPLVCFLLILFSFCQWSFLRNNSIYWREHYLESSIVWSTLLVCITELLSFRRLFTLYAVISVWIFVLLGCLGIAYGLGRRTGIIPVFVRWGDLPPFLKHLLVAIVCWVGMVGVIALVAPPNTADSLTYHMSRVVHWVQNKSVRHYPTFINRQLFMPPWAEFCIAHFQILCQSDRMANLVQWAGWIGCLMGVSAIAKRLGADQRGQFFASAMTTTLPMAILQGSSTQNDLVLSFWLVCFVYYVLALLQEPFSRIRLGMMALSAGLAVLTKGTAFVYILPFLGWFLIAQLSRNGALFIECVLVITSLVVVVNAGHFVRNFELYHQVLGPSLRYSNELWSPAAVGSNIIRNIALHFTTPSSQFNAALSEAIRRLHSLLKIDPSDPRTTWGATQFQIRPFIVNEDYSGNPLHLILLGAPLWLYGRFSYLLKGNRRSLYLVALGGQFLLFCLLIKWQPWHTRLHLPLFVLAAPITAVAVCESFSQSAGEILICGLFIFSLPFVFCHEIRPLLGTRTIWNTPRLDQYFVNDPSNENDTVRMISAIKNSGCRNIGLFSPGSNWPEYRVWAVLNAPANHPIRLEHVRVANVSKIKYTLPRFNNFIPCAIVSFNTLSDTDGLVEQ